ncbi:hypothetical protein Q7C_940 [Methylophaga frappieri]|uniref:Uncharacterized protein n=1 Tax=Methylophaga frappieri (strain ATCC BAA-2434 / DSM 25690 / JAM7) TaxID=754477 RepID=I1YGR6_METFJ|nr:hypothetical protein Q7C_940 [Methylophaga frappieri]
MQTVMMPGAGCGTLLNAAHHFYGGAAVAFRRFQQCSGANLS